VFLDFIFVSVNLLEGSLPRSYKVMEEGMLEVREISVVNSDKITPMNNKDVWSKGSGNQ